MLGLTVGSVCWRCSVGFYLFLEGLNRTRSLSCPKGLGYILLSSAQLWPEAGLFKWLHWSVKWRSLHCVANHRVAVSIFVKKMIRFVSNSRFYCLGFEKTTHTQIHFHFCLLKVFLFQSIVRLQWAGKHSGKLASPLSGIYTR